MTTDTIVEDILKLARRKAGNNIVDNICEVQVDLMYALGRIMDTHRQGERLTGEMVSIGKRGHSGRHLEGTRGGRRSLNNL